MALRLDPMPVVWGITGNLGGGKSLSAVCLASYAMARGYYVVSNITLNLDELALEYGNHVRRLYTHFSFEDEAFDPFSLPTGSPRGTRGGKRVLVIMDECAEWIDQYTSTATNPRIKRFLSWLRHSSKRSQDVILVVQRLDYLNKNIRLLVSKWVIVDDLRVWRMPVLKMRVPFMGGFVMQRVFDRNRKLVQGPCIVSKAAFGRFYDTAECLNTQGAAINTEYSVPILNNYPFLGWVATFLLTLFFMLLALSRLSGVWDALDQRSLRLWGDTQATHETHRTMLLWLRTNCAPCVSGCAVAALLPTPSGACVRRGGQGVAPCASAASARSRNHHREDMPRVARGLV